MEEPPGLVSLHAALAAVGLDLRFSEYWLLVWAGAAVTGILYSILARERPPGAARSVGLGLMSVPVWMAIWGFVDSISVLTDPNSVLRPISRAGLSRTYAHGLIRDIGYLGSGFLLWTLHQGFPLRVRELAARLRDEGFPMGRSGRESTSSLHGYAWFPVLLLGTIAFNLLIRQAAPALNNGNESDVWANLTLYHVVMISLTAAFTEELVYRVFLLAVLQRILLRVGASARASIIGAVVGQAILFGLAHAGYGTWSHVLLPAGFGIIAGIAAVRFGLWSAIVLHFLVDIYALGAQLFTELPWFAAFLTWGLLVNIAVALGIGLRWAWTNLRPAPPSAS